jgi:nucleoside-diphosphate-sugar epimerase
VRLLVLGATGFVDDVGAAIVHAAAHPSAALRMLDVAERTPADRLTRARRFADALRWRGTIELDDASRLAAIAERLNLGGPLHPDAATLHDALGFGTPTSADAALRATVAAEHEAGAAP